MTYKLQITIEIEKFSHGTHSWLDDIRSVVYFVNKSSSVRAEKYFRTVAGGNKFVKHCSL